MKVVLLHGSAINSSRQKLVSLKSKFDTNNVVTFEEGFDSQTIMGSLMTQSLLPEEQLIVLENPPEDFIPTTNYQLPTTLLLWFDHEISEKKSVMEWAKKSNGQILYFPESREVSVFPFLDMLGNKDQRAYLEMDKLKKAGLDGQYLITMIFYLLRNLVATPKMAKDFVKRKNAKIRANFSQEELINLYKFVIETDFKIKSGLLETSQAEFSLVNLFCH